MADTETDVEALLRQVFDLFMKDKDSPLIGLMSPSTRSRGKISRVTFNTALRPIWNTFSGNPAEFVFEALSAYLHVWRPLLRKNNAEGNLTNPTLFRAIMLLFPAAAERVSDRHGEQYTVQYFVPIRLTQTPARCRVRPRAGIKVGIGRRLNTARDAEQRAERVERVETPVEAERELIEVGL